MLRRTIVEIFVLSLIGFGILLIITFYPEEKSDKFQAIPSQEITLPEVNIEFGVEVDSLKHHSAKVKRNEHVSDILRRFNVSYATIDRLSRQSEEIFDVKKIKRGNTYHIYYSGGNTARKVHYFIYEKNDTSYINYDLYNPENIEILKGKKLVRKKEAWVKGTIDNSLWMTLSNTGDDPLLALKLSEIYAWTIDFFDLRKGDRYVARYNENYVDGEKIGNGQILSVVMVHKGERFYAFHYDHDTIDDYFDEDGASLRRTLLKAPLNYRRISSGYSSNRYHPVLKVYRPHRGVDYAAPRGTHVFSIGDGEVIKKAYQRKGGGRYLKIKHNSIYTSVYMHLSGYASGIYTGKRVKQGERIGYVGSSGLATGPHLDFRIYKHGSPVNPLKVESPPANPIDSSHLDEYKSFIEPLKADLDKRLKEGQSSPIALSK